MNSAATNLSALLSELGAYGARKLSQRLKSGKDEIGDPATRDAVEAKMRALWSSMGCGEATQQYFLKDAFNTRGYAEVVRDAEEKWGSLRGRRVFDLGCGWGGLSVVLARAGAEVTFCDHVPAHVEVTGLRVPSARGSVADARDVTAAFGSPLPRFDFVFAHALIEHVGNDPDHRGEAGPSLDSKRKVFEQAAALLEPGGGAYFSTGNYAFPLDGEIKAWFFHWLPRASQARVLEAIGLQADNYGLLTWAEFEALARGAGFAIERVHSGSADNFVILLRAFAALVGPVGLPLHPSVIDELKLLMAEDPRFMPNWSVFLRKL